MRKSKLQVIYSLLREISHLMEIPLLAISFFSLGLIYCLLVIINFFRFFRFKYFSRDAKIAKKFYIALFITNILRAVSFILACVTYREGITDETIMTALRGTITGTEEIRLFPQKLFLFMIIPEFMVITCFLILFWQMLALFKHGHANLFRVACTGKGKLIFIVTVGVLASLQMLMIGLYLGSQVSALVFSIECTVLNFMVTFSIFAIMIAVMFMYSGSPYKSPAYKIKMKKLAIANLIWCICRCFRGISGAFDEYILTFMLQGLSSVMNDSIALPILVILIFVIEEVFPMLVVLDWSFMEIFVIHADVINYSALGASQNGEGIVSNEIQEQLQAHIFQANIGNGGATLSGIALQNQEQSSQMSSLSPDLLRQPLNSLGQPEYFRQQQANRRRHSGGVQALFLSLQTKNLMRSFGLGRSNTQQVGAINQGAENDSASSIRGHSMIRVTNTESNNITSSNTPYISAKQSQSSQQQIELQAKPNQQPQYNYRQLLQLNESQELIEEEQAQRFAVLKSDFSLISLFDYQKVNGLGRLHLAKLKDQQVICREIQFNRVKDYVLEDIIKDMQQTMKLGLRQAILPILGIYQDPKTFTLNIFMPKMLSLFQFINQGKHHLTASLKKDIALGIANALREIHQKPRDIMRDSQQGYYSHTHLSSHNVLLDVQDLSNLQVLLADMESENLRKYAKLFMQYNFINAWSPPELMINDSSRRVSDTPPRSQNSQVFLNLSQQSDNSGNGDKRSIQNIQNSLIQISNNHQIDCYSFGMILWELEHEESPFHGKSDLDIRTLVCDQSMRPTISPKANPGLQALIRSCWHKRADRRPNIEQIYQELQGVEFQSEIAEAVQAASQIAPSLLKLKSCQLKTPGVRSRGSSRSKAGGNESGGSFYISFRNSDIQE